MYAYIHGVVAEKGDGALVIDCGGVGYQLMVSATTLAQAPAVGDRMKCFTWLSVREDAMELFGFATREEKTMFLRLYGVSGVGAKSALQILSALSVHELSLAVVTGDAAALARAQGVGKKTAQRIILELKDKVSDEELTGGAAIATAARGRERGDATGEAIEALMALGYQSSEAAQAVAALSPLPGQVSEIVRLALKGMSK